MVTVSSSCLQQGSLNTEIPHTEKLYVLKNNETPICVFFSSKEP